MKKRLLFVLTALLVFMTGCEFDKPTGDGIFSVSPTQQVRIASGNLVYDSVADVYSFAQHQFDYGDYFRWGTGSNPLSMQGNFLEAFDDWGSHMDGGWRTLTADEWRYLVFSRPGYDEKYAYAIVCGVKGMLLLPDNFEGYVNTTRWDFADNEYDAEEWADMETAGCVFLPAAGRQESDSHVALNTEKYGYYWTSSSDDYSATAFRIATWFDEIDDWMSFNDGCSVRLVKNI